MNFTLLNLLKIAIIIYASLRANSAPSASASGIEMLRGGAKLNIENDFSKRIEHVKESFEKLLHNAQERIAQAWASLDFSSQKNTKANKVTDDSDLLPLNMRKRAVVRPFCIKDYHNLIDSFNAWDEFAPCYFKPQSVKQDLLVYFSRNIHDEAYKEVRSEVESLVEKIKQKKWFQTCFDDVELVEAHLHEKQDVYNPSEIETNKKWNSGPNLQFETIVEQMQSTREYQVFYYMEPDSVPQKPYFLEKLFKEAEAKAPFGVLGSKYVGQRWDQFLDQLPLGMVHHLNGNAVYNLTHPLLETLLEDLKNPDSEYTSSYDLRLAEILLEGPNSVQVDELEKVGYVSTNLIGNFAQTIVTSPSLSDEIAVVHGAHMVDDFTKSMALVVRAWSQQAKNDFMADFKFVVGESANPFQEIIFEQNICKGVQKVNEEWFMELNVYHRLKQEVHVPALKNGKPLLQYEEKEGGEKEFHPFRIVYNKEKVEQYCEEINGEIPTAKGYVEFLGKQVEEIYSLSNINKHGSLDAFVLHDAFFGTETPIPKNARLLGVNDTSAPTPAPTKNFCKQYKSKKKCEKQPDCTFSFSQKKCVVSIGKTSKPTQAPTPFDCANLKRSKCKKHPQCAYSKITKTCSQKTDSPTMAPIVPTLNPTNSPTINKPNLCGIFTKKNVCDKAPNCWFHPHTKKCVEDKCSSRSTYRICLKTRGCGWESGSCKDLACAVLPKGKCNKLNRCSWNGSSCVTQI